MSNVDQAPDPRVVRTPLPRIVAKYEDKAMTLRTAVDCLEAKFADGTPDTNVERKKIETLIKMILQQHLKVAANAIKVLVLSLMEGKVVEGIEVLKHHLAQLAAMGDGLTMARAGLVGALPEEPEGPGIEIASEAGLKQQGLRLLRNDTPDKTAENKYDDARADGPEEHP